jgi:acyl-[acyl-carrier-protein]-phospholipid O-acyltransferase/long-chain-fatty-acid--[acyl-carrier-protein] ligase
MRAHAPFSKFFFKFLAMLARPFCRYKIFGSEWDHDEQSKKIIIIDRLGFIELFILINLLNIQPVFLEDEPIIRQFKFLFRPTKTKLKKKETLIVSLESLKGLSFLSLNEYAYLAYMAGKLHAEIIPISITHHHTLNIPIINSCHSLKKLFFQAKIEFLPKAELCFDTNLSKKQRRQLNANSIYNISSELIYKSKNTDQTIYNALTEAARQFGHSHEILEDPLLGKLNYQKTLIAIRLFANKFDALLDAQQTIGLMLPNACGAAISFFSLLSAGKTPAMINFTSGQFNILNSCKAADIKEIITSKSFIKNANLEPLIETLKEQFTIHYIEDIKSSISAMDKLMSFLLKEYPLKRASPDDIAAILFTSGSEGKPKGVALSHRNILSNAAQTAARIHFDHTDIVLNILPVFHCFGLNIGLILPMISGVKVYLYPTPLHYKTIPELIHKIRATIFFGTDTFLSSYAKVSKREQYETIRYVIAGAEKLKLKTKALWKEKFNIHVLEGYGVTETSPVISLSTPAFNKDESAGLFLPKINYSLAEVVGVKDGGRLSVKGPNIMMGYLHADQPGVIQPTPDGWYDTGDIVEIDSSGFLSIKGRAKRFAKIGGEMISLAAVDGFASELWPDALSAAVAQTDPKKGQAIILLTTHVSAKLEDLRAHIKSIGLTELYVPSQLVVVEELPLLGSGKIDYTKLSELAPSSPW